MEMIAENIAGIISDYQNEEGVQLTGKNVLDWVRQFEEADQQFVMEEFYHLLNQGIYVSRSTAKVMLFEHIQYRANQ